MNDIAAALERVLKSAEVGYDGDTIVVTVNYRQWRITTIEGWADEGGVRVKGPGCSVTLNYRSPRDLARRFRLLVTIL